MAEERNVKPGVKRNVVFLLLAPGISLLLDVLPEQGMWERLSSLGWSMLLLSIIPAFVFALNELFHDRKEARSYLLGCFLTFLWIVVPLIFEVVQVTKDIN